MKLEIDIDDVAAKEIARLEKRIETLKKKNENLLEMVAVRDHRLKEIANVREAIVNAAYVLDGYFGSDE